MGKENDRARGTASEVHGENIYGKLTIHKRVIMPGSANRVDVITSTWDKIEESATLDRGYRVASGQYGGVDMSVVSCGLGGVSYEIPLYHLLNKGADTFIRVGTTGTLHGEIRPGDVIINDAMVRRDGTSEQYVMPEFPGAASIEVTMALIEAAERLGVTYHVGTGYTASSFFQGQARPGWGGYHRSDKDGFFEDMKAAGVLNFENEGATLLTLSRLFGVRAGMVASVVANRITGEWVSHCGENQACHVASEAMKILAEWDAKKLQAGKKYFFPGLLL